jgi:hypothetical protein
MVITVDTKLEVSENGVKQSSVAENFPERKLILINRSRWSEIKNERVKEGIALHEFASLKGLESTGRYSESAKYLAIFGLSVDSMTRSDLDEIRLSAETEKVPVSLPMG